MNGSEHAEERDRPRVKVLQIVWQTRGILWQEVRRRWFVVASMVLLGVLLGIVPTFKTELESGVLQQINKIVREENARPADDRRPPFSQRLEEKIERYEDASAAKKRDWMQTITASWFDALSLKRIFVVYVFISLLGYVLDFASSAAKSHLQAHFFGRLRAQAAKTVLTMNTSELPRDVSRLRNYSADVLQRGAGVVAQTYGHVVEILEHMFALATAIFFVFTRSWVVAVIFAVFAALQVFLSFFQARRLQRRRREYDEKRWKLMERSDEIIEKREVLLAWDQERPYSQKLDNLTDDYAKISRTLEVREASFNMYSLAVNDLGRIFILLAAVAIATGYTKDAFANIGDAYFLIALYYRLLRPSMALVHRYDALRRTDAIAGTFLDLVNRSRELGPRPEKPEGPPPAIELTGVTFGYEPDQEILSNCSFTIPARQITLLRGPSGSGKTTIARLLFGFWKAKDPHSITIGGKPITEYGSPMLRRLSSYIAQSDHIIDETVEDNLKWAWPEPSEEAMDAVLAAVGLEGRRKEPAEALSLGEKQRLSLARLMLDDAPIAILDEPMTGLEPELLDAMLEYVKAQLGNGDRTVLIISHQSEFESIAHQIVELGWGGMASVRPGGAAPAPA